MGKPEVPGFPPRRATTWQLIIFYYIESSNTRIIPKSSTAPLTPMKRKNFLLLSAAGTAAVAFPVWHYFLRDIEYPPLLAQPALLPDIWEPETLQKIGLAYQEQVPTESSENKLAKLLLKDLNPKSSTWLSFVFIQKSSSSLPWLLFQD